MANKYSVIFTGTLEEEQDIDSVKSRITNAFKLKSEQVDMLFEQPPKIIKEVDSLEEANNLVSAFKSCGVICEIKPTTTTQPPIEQSDNHDIAQDISHHTNSHGPTTDENTSGNKPPRQKNITGLFIVFVAFLAIWLYLADNEPGTTQFSGTNNTSQSKPSIFPTGHVTKDAAIKAISEVAVIAWYAEKCGGMTRDNANLLVDDLIQYVARSPVKKDHMMEVLGRITTITASEHKSCASDEGVNGFLIYYREWMDTLGGASTTANITRQPEPDIAIRYAKELQANISTLYPHCANFYNMIGQMAQSNEPANIRIRKIDRIFDSAYDARCVN